MAEEVLTIGALRDATPQIEHYSFAPAER